MTCGTTSTMLCTPPTKSASARHELFQNHERADRAIAKTCGCCPSLVGGIRKVMESEGSIPRWRGKATSDSPAATRVRELLRSKWDATDNQLAGQFGCSKEMLRRTRKMLEAEGLISMWRGGDNGVKTEAIRKELLGNYQRPNRAVSATCCTTARMVSVVRERMEQDGVIPRWRGHENGEEGYTYFARSKVLGLIKIGKTIHPERRQPLLNSQSADLVEVIGWVRGAGVECNLHRGLKSFRHHNEWFNPTPEVEAAIARAISDDRERGD